MNRCSKCNNELAAGARFCNICGMPIPVPAASVSLATPVAPTGLKHTINPDIRRVRPSREGKTSTDFLASDASQDATPVKPGTPDKPMNSAGSNAPEPKAATEQKQNMSRLSNWINSPVIPKTTIEFTSVKMRQADQKQKSALLGSIPKTTAQAKEAADIATSPLSDAPAPDKTSPPPNVGSSRVPGIIRPIANSASLRQNVPPGQTPPDPMSPLPEVPNTPPMSGENAPYMDNSRFPRWANTPTPGPLAQDNQRQAESSKPGSVPPRQPVKPTINNNATWQQARPTAGPPNPPLHLPQTPRPSLHDMPTNYLQVQKGNGNGANSTANRQELPLFSPESFAYTSKAAQHWRSSWRDLQNAEAGPAEEVSKGQATVLAPLASRKDSFLRLRAIRSKQNQRDGGEKNFGFWVILFLMICLIGGLAAYIIYSYLPNNTVAVRITQPTGGAQQPSFSVVGTPAQIFTRGQSLRAHGNHFGTNDPIKFLLDSTTPVLASNGSPLSAQSDSQGAFDVTILVGKNWAVGAHVIAATDTQAKVSAYIDIQVNLANSPVTSNNNTALAFTLNGQPIDLLTFRDQIGQPTPPAQRITFTNTSGTPLQWSATTNTDQNLNWLTILDSEYAGQLDISQPHSMGISVNPAGLAVTPEGKSPYSGQIVFTINGNTQLTLRVQLTIIDATPEMVFSPNPLVATANADGTCKTGATLTFINLGTTVINWSAHPDKPGNIQFVNGKGIMTEQDILQPSGMNGDTEVVTLRCTGVKAGDTYLVNVFANSTQFTEIVQIG